MPRIILSCTVAACLVSFSGCSKKTSDSGPQGAAEFKTLVTLYYARARNGQPPKSEEDFKSLIRGPLAPVAEKLSVSDVDALFISKRDGKPFVVLYGNQAASNPHNVVAYEQVGVDGKRLVGFSLGMTEEADQARFEELVPNADSAAKAASQ